MRTKNLIDTFIITIAEQRVIHVLSIVKRTYYNYTGLWIRIHFLRIRIQLLFSMRIRIQQFFLMRIRLQPNKIFNKLPNKKDGSKLKNNWASLYLINIFYQFPCIFSVFFLQIFPSWIRIHADPDPQPSIK